MTKELEKIKKAMSTSQSFMKLCLRYWLKSLRDPLRMQKATSSTIQAVISSLMTRKIISDIQTSHLLRQVSMMRMSKKRSKRYTSVT